MENKYKELADFEFNEIDINLKETEFIKEYSNLNFNGFFFVKTVKTDNLRLKEYLNSVNKNRSGFERKAPFEIATDDAKDFIFNFIKNKSLKKLHLSFYKDDDFVSITQEYNSLEDFRKVPIFDINIKQLKKQLYEIAKRGSLYKHWNLSDSFTNKIISDFINILFDNKKCMIFKLADWSGFDEGLYEGFMLINLNTTQITFFAKDEYFG
ncbi:hypothetical protein JI747_015770 [Chryseobacterium sp. RG1]|uniref:Uncharacterized protein n=1 Tax=Chryseobacterium tagetis TaxID=2801334 RepID=A0ABS8A3R5_9FLAO|nr:hypothetical protein [Chryseobacterium tagetis]MCA6068639.1 hypothetical protein [Chryseobacterium tagetis]